MLLVHLKNKEFTFSMCFGGRTILPDLVLALLAGTGSSATSADSCS